MRPINLKVQGINSYVTEQEIKFDKLAESKLFGIFGETGSGKTTILDAIVLALYGSSERETIANMINVNVKSAHVYFEFSEDVDGQDVVYRVKREYKLRDSGVKQDALLTEVVTGKVLADMTESVNDEVLKIIGVGKKEFLKCIALPQGEFDRFLVDTPANRKKTIAKLFNLEHFGVMLQEKIKNRRDITNLKLENVKDKLALYNGVTQEALYSSHVTLKTKQKRLKEVQKEIATNEKKYNQLASDYELSIRLVDSMAQLTMKNAEVKEIVQLRKQIEYTEKYGNLIMFLQKKRTYEEEIKDLKPKLQNDKKDLASTNTKLLACVDRLGALQDERRGLQTELDKANEVLAKYNALQEELSRERENYSVIADKINELKDSIAQLKSKLSEMQNAYDDEAESKNKLADIIDNNNKLLEMIKESVALQTVDDFVEYLNYLKSLVNPEDLQEVYQFNVYDQINDMLLSMQKYELDKRKEVAGLKKSYQSLLELGKDLKTLQSDIESKNKELQFALAKAESNIEKTSKLIISTQTQISERTDLVNSKLVELKTSKTKIDALRGEIKAMVGLEKSKLYTTKVQAKDTEIDNLAANIQSLTDEKNALLVSVEVASAQMESLQASLQDVVATIRTLKIDDSDEIDQSYNMTAEELAEAKARVSEYDTAVGVLENTIRDIKGKIVNKNVTKIEVETYEKSLLTLRDEENRINVEIGVLSNKLDKLKEDLAVVKQLTKEQSDTQKAYDTVQKLSQLIQGGGLLEYVSEEYMMLISEFANKFVYQISKGKYLLRYNGEFYVLDNFNGGVPRGVKSLSGGERFIISLSIALGISQSISVNNNRAFNFFFIDEGFGSLSDDYIENVLNSFNELIKLDFTVGFITHVDRMQEFINNRIIVTKPNNEVGTQIKQYY